MTTLRDGTQGEGVSLSVEDKLKIARKLDELGVHYIEGGWPGSNSKDIEFFVRVRELNLKQAKISAFGSTRRKGIKASEDINLNRIFRVLKLPAFLESHGTSMYTKLFRLHWKKISP